MSSTKNRIIIEAYMNGGYSVEINGMNFMGLDKNAFCHILKILEALDFDGDVK